MGTQLLDSKERFSGTVTSFKHNTKSRRDIKRTGHYETIRILFPVFHEVKSDGILSANFYNRSSSTRFCQ